MPVTIGDVIALGELAWKSYKVLREQVEAYQNVANDKGGFMSALMGRMLKNEGIFEILARDLEQQFNDGLLDDTRYNVIKSSYDQITTRATEVGQFVEQAEKKKSYYKAFHARDLAKSFTRSVEELESMTAQAVAVASKMGIDALLKYLEITRSDMWSLIALQGQQLQNMEENITGAVNCRGDELKAAIDKLQQLVAARKSEEATQSQALPQATKEQLDKVKRVLSNELSDDEQTTINHSKGDFFRAITADSSAQFHELLTSINISGQLQKVLMNSIHEVELVGISATRQVSFTPLQWAAWLCKPDFVAEIVERGAAVDGTAKTLGELNLGNNISDLEVSDYVSAMTPLMIAAYQGSPDILRLLKGKGASLSHTISTGHDGASMNAPYFVRMQIAKEDSSRSQDREEDYMKCHLILVGQGMFG